MNEKKRKQDNWQAAFYWTTLSAITALAWKVQAIDKIEIMGRDHIAIT